MSSSTVNRHLTRIILSSDPASKFDFTSVETKYATMSEEQRAGYELGLYYIGQLLPLAKTTRQLGDYIKNRVDFEDVLNQEGKPLRLGRIPLNRYDIPAARAMKTYLNEYEKLLALGTDENLQVCKFST